MRKIILLVIIVLFTLPSFAQNFEGKVTYSIFYDTKSPQMTDFMWGTMLGAKQEYYIKDGNYKSVSDSNLIEWQLYTQKDNRLYSKMSNSKTIYWNDSMTNNDSIISVEYKREVMEVLGYDCNELILTCKSGVQKYYFSTELKIDPELFKNHHYGNWYAYLKEAKAIPLKMIIETQQYKMTSTATEVLSKEIEASTFQLPENATLAKQQ